MIHVFMVTPMFASPKQDRILEGRRAEDQDKESHWQGSLEGIVSIEPMVAKGNAETSRNEQDSADCEMKPIDSKVPQVKGHSRQRKDKRSDQEQACRPINAAEWDTKIQGAEISD
jgi:hypothetical protein